MRPIAPRPNPPASLPSAAEPKPVRVITYNTASGNPRYDNVPQERFTELPFYRDVIEGKPDAPIIGAQEVGNAQLGRLESLAKNGNFQVVSLAPKPGQSDMILVPKRYEVLNAENHRLWTGNVRGLVASVGRIIKTGELPPPAQLVEPRGYNEVRLRDRETGRVFTVFNTHVSTVGPMRVEQMRELLGAVKAAQSQGPVMLIGDLNTRGAPSGSRWEADDAEIRKMIADAGLSDMGGDPSRAPTHDIDHIYADGFERVSTRYYTGDSVHLDGFSDAHALSDHAAEEDVVRWK